MLGNVKCRPSSPPFPPLSYALITNAWLQRYCECRNRIFERREPTYSCEWTGCGTIVCRYSCSQLVVQSMLSLLYSYLSTKWHVLVFKLELGVWNIHCICNCTYFERGRWIRHRGNKLCFLRRDCFSTLTYWDAEQGEARDDYSPSEHNQSAVILLGRKMIMMSKSVNRTCQIRHLNKSPRISISVV